MESENKTTSPGKSLDQQYWDNQYKNNNTGWDLGEVSPPLKAYIDQLDNKNMRILIPGCGNTYEAEYLLQKGFTDITVIDIAPTLVNNLNEKFAGNTNIRILQNDFFEHNGQYDLILEQTFFCALNPVLRTNYTDKMLSLLSVKGKLAGLLFAMEFENEGPPFGGTRAGYIELFKKNYEFIVFENCYNSFHKRQDSELFMVLGRKKGETV